MTLGEFNAWLEGYEHSFKHDAPDHQQWAVIKAKWNIVITPGSFGVPPAILKPTPPFLPEPVIKYGACDDAKMMGGAR